MDPSEYHSRGISCDSHDFKTLKCNHLSLANHRIDDAACTVAEEAEKEVLDNTMISLEPIG
ncbi:predicted protein [Botrytis cinerea T4]|uniref:Uncharacterized protein n=1 Tax=Botryotinia fuckeliana (strain T4) TaxID=999810 RepID=G2XTR4_BOTF4|nr:predicted protein [Botrytis cinerea T4]